MIKVILLKKELKPSLNKMKKDDFKRELEKQGLSTVGTITVMKSRLQKHLKSKQQEYKDNGVDLSALRLTKDIKPTKISKASETIIVSGSDVKQKIYQVTISNDMIIDTGDVAVVGNYPDGCNRMMDLCVTGNYVY